MKKISRTGIYREFHNTFGKVHGDTNVINNLLINLGYFVKYRNSDNEHWRKDAGRSLQVARGCTNWYCTDIKETPEGFIMADSHHSLLIPFEWLYFFIG